MSNKFFRIVFFIFAAFLISDAQELPKLGNAILGGKVSFTMPPGWKAYTKTDNEIEIENPAGDAFWKITADIKEDFIFQTALEFAQDTDANLTKNLANKTPTNMSKVTLGGSEAYKNIVSGGYGSIVYTYHSVSSVYDKYFVHTLGWCKKSKFVENEAIYDKIVSSVKFK